MVEKHKRFSLLFCWKVSIQSVGINPGTLNKQLKMDLWLKRISLCKDLGTIIQLIANLFIKWLAMGYQAAELASSIGTRLAGDCGAGTPRKTGDWEKFA